jgi:hypothetical protein
MAITSLSAELYLSKKKPLPENVPYNTFYAKGATKVHQDLVPWTGQRKSKTQDKPKC